MRCAMLRVVAAVVLSSGIAALYAEQADVKLKNGSTFRGDVTETGNDVVVRLEWGELRVNRSFIESITPVAIATSQPVTGPAEHEEGEQPEIREAEMEGAPPPTPVNARDIQRLRIHELAIDGPAESVRVQFINKPSQRDLVKEVLQELSAAPKPDEEAKEILEKGKPNEKLQVIVRHTGTKFADRIQIETDPAVFQVFRRRILPLVIKGCARSGCHGGKVAEVFRLPAGARDNDGVVYTSFALMDQIQTRRGPLINRVNPAGSALLGFMLPEADNPVAHPALPKNKRFTALLRSTKDPNYEVTLNWINSLRVPHPEYELEWKPPTPATTQSASAPSDPLRLQTPSTQPAASQPHAPDIGEGTRGNDRKPHPEAQTRPSIP